MGMKQARMYNPQKQYLLCVPGKHGNQRINRYTVKDRFAWSVVLLDALYQSILTRK
jgi:hypothetical protein